MGLRKGKLSGLLSLTGLGTVHGKKLLPGFYLFQNNGLLLPGKQHKSVCVSININSIVCITIGTFFLDYKMSQILRGVDLPFQREKKAV